MMTMVVVLRPGSEGESDMAVVRGKRVLVGMVGMVLCGLFRVTEMVKLRSVSLQ